VRTLALETVGNLYALAFLGWQCEFVGPGVESCT
jgi:hypothetical protein